MANPSSRRSRAGRAAAVAALVVSVLGGCVRQDEPGVRVASKESSIEFGVKLPALAPPPGIGAPGYVAPPVGPPESTELEIAVPTPAPLPPAPPPQRRDPPFCRTAGLSDFPTEAPLRVTAPPEPGTYFYKKTPPQLVETDRYAVGPEDLIRRVVSNVRLVARVPNPLNGQDPPVGNGSGDTETRVWEYDLTTFQPDGVVVADRYRVVDNPLRQSVSSGVNVGPTLYTGQPDRGISLVRREVRGPSGVAVFEPMAPLLLMPLPAVGGQEFQSVAADRLGRSTYVLYGHVEARRSTDACGDVVDGWAVRAQVVFRAPGSSAVEVADFVTYFATGMGGLPVYEEVGRLTAPPNPANGTSLDQALTDPPTVPEVAVNAKPSVLSLARKEPAR